MFKKLACIGLIGFIIPAMGGCPCCGTANCCEQGELSPKVAMAENWLDQAEQKSSTESTSSLATVPVTTP